MCVVPLFLSLLPSFLPSFYYFISQNSLFNPLFWVSLTSGSFRSNLVVGALKERVNFKSSQLTCRWFFQLSQSTIKGYKFINACELFHQSNTSFWELFSPLKIELVHLKKAGSFTFIWPFQSAILGYSQVSLLARLAPSFSPFSQIVSRLFLFLWDSHRIWCKELEVYKLSIWRAQDRGNSSAIECMVEHQSQVVENNENIRC